MTAGAALPAVIEETFQSLLNDNFDDAYRKINDVSSQRWNTTILLLLKTTFISHYDVLSTFHSQL